MSAQNTLLMALLNGAITYSCKMFTEIDRPVCFLHKKEFEKIKKLLWILMKSIMLLIHFSPLKRLVRVQVLGFPLPIKLSMIMVVIFFFFFQQHMASSGVQSLEILNKENVDVLVSDERVPSMSGIELLENHTA